MYGVELMQKFILVYIDWTAVIYTESVFLKGYQALTFAYLPYVLMCGDNRILGVDTCVQFDHITGVPYSVHIENQLFKIVKELHISPYLFGRGTWVYIVKDARGYFHIFKDFWILNTHKHMEMQIMKLVSDKAKEKLGGQACLQYLMTRFVAGEDRVNDTAQHLGHLGLPIVLCVHHRVVSGPVGNPITSYQSCIECLQAFADIINCECSLLLICAVSITDYFIVLAFMDKECGVVHCDMSMTNFAIVRFLPSMVSAADAIYDGSEQYLA